MTTHPTRQRQPSTQEIVVGRDRLRRRGMTCVTALTPGLVLVLGAAVVATVLLAGSSSVEPTTRIDLGAAPGVAAALTHGRDGGWIVATTVDTRVVCFGADVGRGWAAPFGTLLAGSVAAFSGDGRALAVGGEGIVTLRDTSSDSPRRAIHTGDAWTTAVALNNDGTTLAAVGLRTVSAWETTSGRLLARLVCKSVRATAVALAPDGRTLAVGGFGGLVRLVDLPSGLPRIEFRALPFPVSTLTFSGDGQVLVTASQSLAVARVWDVTTGRLRAELRGHDRVVRAVAFAPGGGMMATAATDGTVRLWGTTTGRCVAVLRAEGFGAFALAFSANGQSLAGSGCEQALWVWDLSGIGGPKNGGGTSLL